MPFLLIAKMLFGRVFAFLRGLNVWQLLCLGLGAVLIVTHAELRHTQRQRDAYRHQRDEIARKLDELAKASKLQQQRTRIVIQQGKERIRTVEVQAKRIEAAPIPPGCKTSALIMESPDL